MTLTEELIAGRQQHDLETGWQRTETSLHDHTEYHQRLAALPVAFAGYPNVIADVTHKERHIDPQTWPCTAGELARSYLAATLQVNEAKWIGHRKTDSRTYRNVHDPWFYRPGALRANTGRMVQIDLTGAHWTIAHNVTPDLRFQVDGGRIRIGRGHIFWPRRREVEMLPKPARLAVTGTLAALKICRYHYGKPEHMPNAPTYRAPAAMAWIHMILQAVATEAVRHYGCLHVAVDSYLIPEPLEDRFLAHLQEKWMLPAKVVCRGYGAVYSQNMWEIRATQPADKARSTQLVDQWRKLECGGDPPFQRKPQPHGLAFLDRRIVDQLAHKQQWLAGLPYPNPGWPGE